MIKLEAGCIHVHVCALIQNTIHVGIIINSKTRPTKILSLVNLLIIRQTESEGHSLRWVRDQWGFFKSSSHLFIADKNSKITFLIDMVIDFFIMNERFGKNFILCV